MKVRLVAIAAAIIVVLAVVALPVADRIASRRLATALDHGILLLPSGIGAKYAGVSYSFRTGVATITGLTLTSNADGVVGTETIDRVEATGIAWDLGDEMARIQEAPATLTRDTVIPIAARVSLTGIHTVAPNLKLSLANVTVTGIRLHPWALFQPGIPSIAAIIHQVTSPPPDLEGPNASAAAMAQAIPLLRFGAAAVLAFEYDSATETGLEEDYTVAATADEPAQPRHFSLTRAHLGAGLHDGVFGAVTDENLRESSGGDTVFSVIHLDSAGFDFRAPAERIVAGAPITRDLVNGLKIGDITFSGVTARLPGLGPVTISRMGLDGIGFGHGAMESAHVAVEQLHVTDTMMTHAPAAVATLQSLDLHALTISAAIGFHWNVDQQSVALDRTELRIDELGDLGFEGRVDGFSPALDMQSLRDHAVVREARVRYRDASLVGRLIAAGAARSQTDVASMRQQLIDMLQERALSLGSGAEVAGLVSALTDFIRAPTSLTVAIKPTVPLPLSDLLMQHDQDPQTLLDRLGVTAVANQ